MPISVKIDKAAMGKIVAAIERGVGELALAVATEAKASMRAPKSGRITRFRRRVPPRPSKSKGVYINYRASAPGEPPAVRTGRLYSSVEAWRISKSVWAVGSNVSYADELELGKKRAARPWLVPAVKKIAGIAPAVFARNVRIK